MIPYFELREIPIGGGHSIATFGTLVVLGIFAGAWFAERRARLVGIPEHEIPGAILSAVIPCLILAHLLALLGADHWTPRTLLEFWNGMRLSVNDAPLVDVHSTVWPAPAVAMGGWFRSEPSRATSTVIGSSS